MLLFPSAIARHTIIVRSHVTLYIYSLRNCWFLRDFLLFYLDPLFPLDLISMPLLHTLKDVKVLFSDIKENSYTKFPILLLF